MIDEQRRLLAVPWIRFEHFFSRSVQRECDAAVAADKKNSTDCNGIVNFFIDLNIIQFDNFRSYGAARFCV